MIRTAVLTISDTRDTATDTSGKAVREMLDRAVYRISTYAVIPDEQALIEKELVRFSDREPVDLVLTTGGTGLGPRDVTPEASLAVADREIPGISELIRSEGLKHTPKAALSRGVSVQRKLTLIINLPGNEKGARESLQAVLGILPHAVEMMQGVGH